jgi:hypothetical protein
MEETVYLDVYFAFNFIMDFLTLILSGYITSEKIRIPPCLLAAALGSVFSSLMLFCSMPPYLETALALGVLVPMVFVAFGRKRPVRFFQITLFAFLSSMFLGGVAESLFYCFGKGGKKEMTLGIFLATVLFAFGGFRFWGRGMKRKLDTVVISLSIYHKGREEQLYGLVDSACLLRDPDEGRFVILLKAESALGLLSSAEIENFRLGQGEGVIPLPIRTASGEGNLFAFFPERVLFHRKGSREKKDILVALDFTGGGFAGCPCLVPLGAL